MEKLRLFEGFAGIGAVSKAIERLNIPHKLVGYSEIDNHAAKSFSLIHNVNENLNYGDICLIDETKLPDFDLYTFGSPCQDFSVAGKQEGAKWTCKNCGIEYNPLDVHYTKRDNCPTCDSNNIEKTRSSLVVEALRIIRYKKPKYLLMENVKGLVGKKFKASFDKIIQELGEYGYVIYHQILNAKDYGIPQNRERVFVVGIHKDIKKEFAFPKGFDNGIRLKDLLEDTVDEKYYISDDKTEKLIQQLKNKITQNQTTISISKQANKYEKEIDIAHTLMARDYKGFGNQPMNAVIIQVGMLDIKGNEQIRRVYDPEGVSPALWTMQGGNRQPKIVQRNRGEWKEKEDGIVSCIDANYHKGIDNHAARSAILQYYRIRKLTPLECFRLMGFDDQDYYILKENKVSDTQIYKMAGNSIVVDVLEYIFKNLYTR